MKAVYCTGYGKPEVLEVKEISTPQIGNNEILVKNQASSITRADTMMRQGTPKFARLFLGFNKPKKPISGTGFAGIITKVGNDVTQFKVGDKVCGETKFNFSANAEFVGVDTAMDVIRKMPAGLNFNEAAGLCDGALTSYNFLIQIGQLNKNQHILINGASGALGLAAIQIAKIVGAEVTAVCSKKNAPLVKEFGADHVIDYNKENFGKRTNTYDIIYDAVGKSSFSASKKALTANGQFLSPVLSLPLLFQVIKTSIIGNKKAKFDATGMKKSEELLPYLDKIMTWIEAGKLKNYIDKTFHIDDVVKAHEYVDTGRKRGNVVITF